VKWKVTLLIDPGAGQQIGAQRQGLYRLAAGRRGVIVSHSSI